MPKPMYIRVKDESTGHEFDVRETSPLLAKGLVRQVKADEYPPSEIQRPAKHHIKLAGRSAASRETGKAPAKPEPPTAPAAADEAPEKEN